MKHEADQFEMDFTERRVPKEGALERIKKLLRLGRCAGSTPAEAASALNKARELAEANGIDLNAVPDDTEGVSRMSHVMEKSTKGPAQQLASGIVKRHFGVEVLFFKQFGRQSILFIGVESNCQLAAYVYTFLVRSMTGAWRNRSNRRLRDRGSFLKGYAYAIDELMPRTFHREGLVFSAQAYVEEVILGGAKAKFTEHKAAKGKKARLSDRSLNAGYQAGKERGIHNAIRGTDKELLPG